MPREALQRIAYVEDEPDIQEVAIIALESIGGYEVHAFDHAPPFLEQVEAMRPQLILLDVMLPGMTGPEILTELRARPETKDIPVIFMTAKVQSTDHQRYLDLGAIRVIGKPFDPMSLSSEIEEAWNALED
ncbi:response regulator [Roseomonas sp. 18066]|uniref:response regulator n=1 Tax=Roseomonas sp. 18066 TaxID=2681412 RepID=UPI0013571916|nr:response regulator [Roseomonas sp. 18066]